METAVDSDEVVGIITLGGDLAFRERVKKRVCSLTAKAKNLCNELHPQLEKGLGLGGSPRALYETLETLY
jgi:hypothetical protein